MDFVALVEEELREVGAVLAGDADDEGFLFHFRGGFGVGILIGSAFRRAHAYFSDSLQAIRSSRKKIFVT